MPYRKGGKKPTAGIGAKYRAKKSAARTQKSETRYGMNGVDWNAVKRLADAASVKAVNKNIETQYSQAMFSLTRSVSATTGWSLQPLNLNTTDGSWVPDAAVIFNLGYLSQVGQSVTPGFRQGQVS